MNSIGWNNNTLCELINGLKLSLISEKNSDKIKQIRKDIKFLKEFLENSKSKNNPNLLPLLNSYGIFKDNLSPIEFLWPDFKEFSEITGSPIEIDRTLKRNDLTNNDLFDLTHDFYKSLNHYFFIFFMRNFSHRKKLVQFGKLDSQNDTLGNSLFISTYKETFILANRDHTINDAYTLTHEYGHAISNLINDKHQTYPKWLFCEIDTLFFELAFTDFLENTLKSDEPKINQIRSHNEMIGRSIDLKNIISIIKLENLLQTDFKTNKDLKDASLISCGLSSNETADLLQYSSTNIDIYLTSYLFALELYQMYKTDKDKALYYLKKIILLKCSSPKEYYCNIKRFGLIPNESVSYIHQDFTQSALKLTRKNPFSPNK